MAVEKKVYHLNIFLIKAAFTAIEKIVKIDACGEPIKIAIGGHGEGNLYIKKTPPHVPKWGTLFQDYLNTKELEIEGISALFLIQINTRFYALAFGQGGRFLLQDDVYEERFGLLSALNSVDPNSFRCIDVQSLDAIDSHTRIQAGEKDLYLPFFSRVNLNNTVKILKGFGYKAELLKIAVDDTHAKTALIPPTKKK